MKIRAFVFVALTGIYLSGCQKDSVIPAPTQKTPDLKVTTTAITTTTATPVADTVSENVKGYLRVQMAKDSVNTDNILIDFDPAASNLYVKGEDAPTFQGFGAVSLSGLSSDNVALAIDAVPLTAKGNKINLQVGAKASGNYKLNLLTVSNVPAIFDIWLKDNYQKDSLDFRAYPSYAFTLNTADTASFGSHRFSLVLREHL